MRSGEEGSGLLVAGAALEPFPGGAGGGGRSVTGGPSWGPWRS